MECGTWESIAGNEQQQRAKCEDKHEEEGKKVTK
jgi:hypothetical protein